MRASRMCLRWDSPSFFWCVTTFLKFFNVTMSFPHMHGVESRYVQCRLFNSNGLTTFQVRESTLALRNLHVVWQPYCCVQEWATIIYSDHDQSRLTVKFYAAIFGTSIAWLQYSHLLGILKIPSSVKMSETSYVEIKTPPIHLIIDP